MSRCKLCDNVMKPNEIIWRAERGQHEDLCRQCRKLVLSDMQDAPEDDTEQFVEDFLRYD